MNSLRDLVNLNKKNGLIIAEVGVYKGQTLLSYVDIVKECHGKVYAFDWFKGQLHSKDHSQEIHFSPDPQVLLEEFNSNCKNHLNHIEIFNGDTKDTYKNIENQSLDICYIDASHSYEDVKSDISNFLPKIKKGGIICGDDLEDLSLKNTFTKEHLDLDCTYHLGKPVHAGVIQAVYDIFGESVLLFGHNQWMIKT